MRLCDYVTHLTVLDLSVALEVLPDLSFTGFVTQAQYYKVSYILI